MPASAGLLVRSWSRCRRIERGAHRTCLSGRLLRRVRRWPRPPSLCRYSRVCPQAFRGRSSGRRRRAVLICAAAAPRPGAQDRARCKPSARSESGHERAGQRAPCHGFLVDLVARDPDITLAGLRGAREHAHGVRAPIAGVDRALGRRGETAETALLPPPAPRARRPAPDGHVITGSRSACHPCLACRNGWSARTNLRGRPT